MDFTNMIIQLREAGIVQDEDVTVEPLSGGTSSNINILTVGDDIRYVIKTNDKSIIEAEVQFLSFYKEVSILPKVVYEDSLHQFFVYPYMKGSTNTSEYNKKDVLITLIEQLVKYYKPIKNKRGWGWVHYEIASWHVFLQNEVKSAAEIMNHEVVSKEDITFVRKLLDELKVENDAKQPYLLHGDCGFHNFLFSEGELVGVIDPMPLIGDPLHDIIFSYCSTPEELTQKLIEDIASRIPNWNEDTYSLHRYVMIGLFVRLARCKLHHPQDLDTYLQAWEYWKEIVNYKKT
ncbi:aminoglycoside phosphotransferase family protein, partial [Bacillus massiliigorillae]|uniref:aminoglycoside phosphotransferase family protein n=1 Tax=Bacillus massiliigorillae TaxID=1243664 RepID=UPI0006943D98